MLRSIRQAVEYAALLPMGSSEASHTPLHKGELFQRRYRGVEGERAYKLYVPSTFGDIPRNTVPLLIMLHGCAQTAEDFAVGAQMNVLADRHAFLVAYPEQDVGANGARCWNWFRPEDQKRGSGEPAIIAGMTRQIIKEFETDPSRTYVAGLSAGGAMAVILGRTYAELYAAVGCHSGLPYASARDVASAYRVMRNGADGGSPPELAGDAIRVPTIVFHGDSDETVVPRNGLDVITQAISLNTGGGSLRKIVNVAELPDGHWYRQFIYLDATGRHMAEYWLVKGLGHTWSGGSPHGSHTSPANVDASAEMLRFFLMHRLGQRANRGEWR